MNKEDQQIIEFMLRQWPYIWADSLGTDIKAGIANTYLWPQHNGLGQPLGWPGTRRSLNALGLRQRPKPQFARRAHCEVPRLKNSGWYGRSTKSRLTMMRTGRPGLSVKVGWMLRLRRVISWPT